MSERERVMATDERERVEAGQELVVQAAKWAGICENSIGPMPGREYREIGALLRRLAAALEAETVAEGWISNIGTGLSVDRPNAEFYLDNPGFGIPVRLVRRPDDIGGSE
jgi:hypothetical protein